MPVHTFEEIRDEAERQGQIIDEQKKAEAKKPRTRKRRLTGAEIIDQDMKDFQADIDSFMKEAAPKTPLDAAIDRATGFKPEDAVKAIMEPASAEATAGETEKPETETEQANSETEQPDSETKPAEDETKPAKAETDPAPKEKRDWVNEAYVCFVKDAKDIDPTDPVKAVEAYFRKNASDELKARCKAEGKDAKGCWKFIEAVARKALHGSSGHIDPAVVYAIAMHWFEDVPNDWDKPAPSPKAKTAKLAEDGKRKTTRPKKPAETPSEIRKEKEKARKAAKQKAVKKRKPRAQQGFFFEMLETPEQESEVRS